MALSTSTITITNLSKQKQKTEKLSLILEFHSIEIPFLPDVKAY